MSDDKYFETLKVSAAVTDPAVINMSLLSRLVVKTQLQNEMMYELLRQHASLSEHRTLANFNERLDK